jgi:hypothetical protein
MIPDHRWTKLTCVYNDISLDIKKKKITDGNCEILIQKYLKCHKNNNSKKTGQHMPVRWQARAAVAPLHVTFFKMCRSTGIQDVVAYSEARLWLAGRASLPYKAVRKHSQRFLICSWFGPKTHMRRKKGKCCAHSALARNCLSSPPPQTSTNEFLMRFRVMIDPTVRSGQLKTNNPLCHAH